MRQGREDDERARQAARAEGQAGHGSGGDDDRGTILSAAEAPLPLSPVQRRLWLSQRLDPESPSANRPAAFHLEGPLDEHVLRRSVDEIVRRHEVLRTVFPVLGEGPVQRVLPARSVDLTVVDLRSRPPASRQTAAECLAGYARQVFDLGERPPFRAVLLRLAPEDHVLLFVMHHIIFDGWSEEVLHRELVALYAAFRLGLPSPLPPLPIRYGDYAVRQQEHLRSPRHAEQVAYWRRRLEGLVPGLALPRDHPRPGRALREGGQHAFVLSPALTEKLREVSRQERVTLFMTLLALFKVLLGRYAGQEDVAVGTPVAGRGHLETEPLLGCFINLLVLRTDLSGSLSFRTLLRRVRVTTLEALAHQDVPYERLAEELRPPRRPHQWPFFDVLFQLRNLPSAVAPRTASGAEALRIEPFRFDPGLAGIDLTMEFAPGPEGLRGKITYARELFASPTVARMAEHFRCLAEAAVARPDASITELPLLTAVERHETLYAWNPIPRPACDARCLHERFEEQARRTPDAPAVSAGEKGLTYRELDRCANRLAHYLQGQGIGPERLVALVMERSLTMVVSLLAVLKAGGAYLPLEPDLPQERLRHLLEDARPALVLTESPHAHALPADGVRMVCLDTIEPALRRLSEERPEGGATPHHLAYVLYTSGSLGRPKGVLVEHRQIASYVHAVTERIGLDTGRSFALVLPLSVDSSQTVLFPALVSGGCLHVLSRETASDPPAFRRYLARHAIDLLKIAPSHWDALQAGAGPDETLPHRWLVMGGEALTREIGERLRRVSGPAVFNHYGPTEATVGVLTYRLPEHEPLLDLPTVPIGRPLSHVRAYLLDSHLEPVPVGVAGELYLGGEGVSRGYLGRPAETAERFVPDPFGAAPGQRLYRTGDRASYLSDGTVVFLGRVDGQMKVRGYRIEPAEVETAVAAFPGVHQTAVRLWEGADGAQQLVAYVTPTSGGPPDVSALRAFLQQKVPAWMIPAAFVWMEGLPRTPNGKLNRRALPPPPDPAPRTTPAVPRTQMEEIVAGIWEEVLGLPSVGVDDNFFELGGHSLLAMRVASRLRERLGAELSPSAFFRAQTVAALAQEASRWLEGQEGSLERALGALEGLSEEEALRRLKQAT